MFDPKLSWRAHVMKVIAKTSHWMQLLWRLTKMASGLSPSKTHQFCNTITIPALTYACDVWYTPPCKLHHCRNARGSIHATKLLQPIQARATRLITGSLRGTTFDILDVHVNTPPVDLLFRKAQINAAAHLSSLLPKHPLHMTVHRVARQFVNRHKSPLHYLFHITQIDPKCSEIITPTCRHPLYTPPLTTRINTSKESALELAQKTHQCFRFKMYCDGSVLEGRVGAAAILYKHNNVIKASQYHLGKSSEHTIYEAELVGILLAFNLLTSIASQLTRMTLIRLDSQARIHTLNNQKSEPSHYLLNHVLTAAESLHIKQDKLINAADFRKAKCQGIQLTVKTRDVTDLKVHWIPGHKDFIPNEKADELAKKAAKGESNPNPSLPKLLRHSLPTSTAAIKQDLKLKVQNRWK